MNKENFILLLDYLGFRKENQQYTKLFGKAEMKVDVNKKEIIYPEGLTVNHEGICDFSAGENFVVFECVYRLLEKGYKPKHIELEPTWHLGHGASGGRGDILVKDQQNNDLLLIECKIAGNEFSKAWNRTEQDGGQLFSYAHQIPTTKYLCLYASNFTDGAIVRDSKIISLTDNEKFLQQSDNLRSFASKIKNAADRFSIWRDTYQRAYSEVGIFENSIQAYQIGKSKYTLEDDTRQINVRDKNKKYHQFRTILRKHSIARRETAFEALVNLFLCKIVDEEVNPKDLKFYWKGIAYDNYFDFVDRLLGLYQQGMGKFLNENISYISNEEIDNAFWVVKSNRNATKEQIQKYFRELKFFNNTAFSFLDTHNEKLFYKNTQVLLEVVQMWQNLRLKSNEQNQFLGDMFEFFLDNSIKQSNGQFFTPLPICKFIVSALPLKVKAAASKDALRVIDYACGSGHFLNEYAYQITSIAKQQGKKPASYYSNITGIEKEYRLAKVAKVASYMHEQGQIKILDFDALANHETIKKESYDVLVANPPFAVEGFLQTLSDEDKHQYELIKKIDDSSNTNVIQCFFLERAHYLMAPEGVVGVIVPSSILSIGDSVHTRTRELLLQYFDFVSIVKLGNGTFGKTGTNTVVLFLRRKPQRPECAQHYAIRVNEFFQGDTKHKVYKDKRLVQAYCRHINIPYEEYAKLLTAQSKKQIESLFQFEMFKEYLQHWEKSTEVKNLRKARIFQEKNKKDQQQDLDNLLMSYLHKCEKDKLFYFILAHQQAGKVLIVNAPKEKEQKKFLGYEWGAHKGSEGIKYNGGDTVNDIVTPMFDPKNLENPDKINTAIRKNFIGELTGHLPKYCQLVNLVDMLDFSRIKFNKKIYLNLQNTKIESNWPFGQLEKNCEIEGGKKAKAGLKNYLEIGDIDINSKQYDIEGKEKLTVEGSIEVPKNTLLISTVRPTRGAITITKTNIYVSNAFLRIKLRTKYIFHILNTEEFFSYMGNHSDGISYPVCKEDDILRYQIPLPPSEVRQKIVKECEAVDNEAEKSRQIIVGNKQKMKQKILKVMNAGYETKRLSMLLQKPEGHRTKIEEKAILTSGKLPVITQGSENLIAGYTNEENAITDLPLVVFGDHTCSFKYVDFPFVRGADGTQILKFNQNEMLAKYFYFLSGQIEIINKGEYERHFKYLKNIFIPVPLTEVQEKIVIELEKLEAKITEAQAVLDAASDRKNAILKKYL